jgi:TPR repeat protein
MGEFGRQLMDGEYGDTRASESEKWLEAAAEAGDVAAQFHLSLVYQRRASQRPEEAVLEPVSCAEDVVRVIKEAKKRARMDKKNRIRELSKSASASKAASKTDAELAEFWCRRASKGGHGRAMTLLGNLLLARNDRSDQLEGFLWHQRATKLSPPDADACYNLGLLHFEGRDGVVSMDLDKSFAYFQQGAEQGDVSSIFWVGYCYATGDGGALLRPQRALDFLHRAADLGHTSARYYISLLYRGGTEPGAGVEGESALRADTAKFREYLNKAVEEDEDPDAVYCLADMYMHGLDGTERSALRAMELYHKASDMGHMDATVSLGAMYYNGLGGLPRNPKKAFEMYNLAAEEGHREAWRNLAAMYAAGDGVPKCVKTAKGIMTAVFPEEQMPASDKVE